MSLDADHLSHNAAPSEELPYVLILFYSRKGATLAMAEKIARGINAVSTTLEARLRTVPPLPTYSDNSIVSSQIHHETVPESGYPYVTLDDLRHCSGLAMGSPTRFGNMAAPLKHFLDATSELWIAADLVDKPAAVFTSTSTLHGGQESTLLTMALPLIHHGMVWMGHPFTDPNLSQTTTGGTPYGPSHWAGLQSHQTLDSTEAALCIAMGKRLASLALKMGSSTAQ